MDKCLYSSRLFHNFIKTLRLQNLYGKSDNSPRIKFRIIVSHYYQEIIASIIKWKIWRNRMGNKIVRPLYSHQCTHLKDAQLRYATLQRMAIVHDEQTCNCAKSVTASFAQNVFLLLQTIHFSTWSPIVFITQNNFLDFQA
jgi:hypothetical protein